MVNLKDHNKNPRRNLMARWFRSCVIPVFLSMCLIFQTGVTTAAAQQLSTSDTLKVVIFPFLSFAPILIADEEGYFAEHGLQIEYIKIKENVAIQALSSGEVDVWGGLISTGALNAMYRGANIRFVADKGFFAADGCPSFGLVARKALVETGELNGPVQLNGKNVAWYRASFEEYFLEKVLQEGGLKLDDVQKITIPPPADLGAMAKDRLDLTVTNEPWVTRLVQGGHGILWWPVQKTIPGFHFGLILYGPNLLEKNPEAGRRFMVAYLKGVRQFSQGKTARNLEILAKRTGLAEDLLRTACWPQVRNDGRINVQSIMDFQNWALTKGYLDHLVTKDIFMETSFIKKAVKILNKTP
jgi:NitT/TauT family transport system substrate-binding protein